MLKVGKNIRRSNSAVLESLKLTLGNRKLHETTRNEQIDYGKKRAKHGAGPTTLAINILFIGTLLAHAVAVYGIAVSPEEVRLARATGSSLEQVTPCGVGIQFLMNSRQCLTM